MRKLLLGIFLALPALFACSQLSDSGSAVPGGSSEAPFPAPLTDEEVRTIALQQTADADQAGKIAPKSNPFAQRLAKLTKKLKTVEPGTAMSGIGETPALNFKTYLSKDLHAFAGADGSVRITSGLMQLMKDDELLAVLGHEIGHLQHGDCARILRAAARTGEATPQPADARFSPAAEEAADSYALAFLKLNGKKPAAAVKALRTLAKLESKAVQKPTGYSFLVAHPAAGARADRLQDEIAGKAPPALPEPEGTPTPVPTPTQTPLPTVTPLPTSTPTPIVYKYRSDYPNTAIDRKDTQLWEYVKPGYYLAVAVMGDAARAWALLRAINTDEQPATVQEIAYEDRSFFRLLLGPYKTKKLATAASEAFKRRYLFPGDPVLQQLDH